MAEPTWDNTNPISQNSTPNGGVPTWDNTTDMEDKFGGLSGMAKAAGLGVLRGATIGGSDVALTKSGLVNPETIKGLQDTNPGSSLTGEVTGAVGSSLLAPELAPASLIGKAGKVVQGGIEGLDALKALDKTTKVGKILGSLGDVGASTAGSAVEGALYSGVGNSLNEYSLGDPDLNGEKVLANFGYGGLFGGALGGALKAAEIGVPESVTAARDGIKSLRDKLIGTGEGDAGIAGRFLRSQGKDTLAESLENRTINLDTDEKTGLIKDITKTLSSVNNNIETSLKKLNSTIRPAERDVLIDTAANPDVIAKTRQDAVNVMNQALSTAEERPALYDPGPIAKLEKIRDDFVDQLKNNQTPAEIHSSLIEAKQMLQGLAYTKTSSTAFDTKALIESVSGKIKDITHDPDIFGLAGSAQSAHDEMLSKYYAFNPPNNKATPFRKAFMEKDGNGRWQVSPAKIETSLKQNGTPKGDQKLELLNNWWAHLQELPDHLENTFQNVPNDLWDENKFSQMRDTLGNAKLSSSEQAQKYINSVQNMKGKNLGLSDYLSLGLAYHHPVIGAAMEAYNIASRPTEYIHKLASLERVIGATTEAIGKGSRAIFDPSIKLGEASRGVISRVGTQGRQEQHKNIQDQIAKFQSDPNSLADKLGGSTDALYKVAPKMSQSVQGSTIRAVEFLQSKLPPKPPPGLFGETYEVSPTEAAQFDRYLSVVEKPMLALDQVRSGLIGPETMEALTSVYPKLLDQMRQAVTLETSMAIKKDKPIPYQLKQSISQFLGEPIDQSLNPQSILNNQMAFQKAPQPQGQSKGGFKDMEADNRFSLKANDEA